MSLNGDLSVNRNNRSVSQISVYNYPEHLNPFYEDDQHKRLRFWHIITKNDKNNRRNSFSISDLNLKDIWSFKSFRSKKKSSTLGINKTSESPPQLRRDIQYGLSPGTQCCTYDRRLPYANNTNASNNNHFQRNVAYRTSLQNVHSGQESAGGFGFRRNDDYRSTMQYTSAKPFSQESLKIPPARRYVYGGSVTPQPPRSSETGRGRQFLSIGSSQLSVASTNPFESDKEEDNEDGLIDERTCVYTSTPVKKAYRKKRQAPAPPLRNSQITNNGSHTPTTETSHQSLHIDESLDISNLAAEIESFVQSKSKDTPTVDLETAETKLSQLDRNSANIEDAQLEKSMLPSEAAETSSTSEPYQNHNHPKHSRLESDIPPEKVLTSLHEVKSKLEEGHIECIHVHVEQMKTAPDRNELRGEVTSFKPRKKKNSEVGSKPNIQHTLEPVITSSAVVKTADHQTATNGLQIIEDSPEIDVMSHKNDTKKIPKPQIARKPNLDAKPLSDVWADIHKPTRTISHSTKGISQEKPMGTIHDVISLGQPATKSETESIPIFPAQETTLSGELQIVESDENEVNPNCVNGITAIHINDPPKYRDEFTALYREKQPSNLEWKKSSLAPLETNVPPEKRKSVKDIIESINRSQRLLNASANKTQRPILTTACDGEVASSVTNYNEYTLNNSKVNERKNNLNDNIKSQNPLNESIVLTNVSGANVACNNEEEADIIDIRKKNYSNDTQKLNNSEIFQKCRVEKEEYQYRESSPTAFNLDWNPVPKPKRTKNMET